MSKTVNEIRSLARSHSRTAINVLVGVMRSKDATHAARVSAANAILDRGWGKAAQALQTGDDGALELNSLSGTRCSDLERRIPWRALHRSPRISWCHSILPSAALKTLRELSSDEYDA